MAGAVELTLRGAQMKVFLCKKRFRVLVAGRRFGKTQLALVELLRAVWNKKDAMAWYVAPSYRQAKQIAWQRLKSLTRPYWAGKPNETDLSIRIVGGGTIALRGADRPDSLRGSGLDFVVLDEYASMRPDCWSEVLRPALSDRQGGALFMGTPQGSDHLFEKFEHAGQDPDQRGKNRAVGPVPGYSGRTFSACGPFCPWVVSNSTFWFSSSER